MENRLMVSFARCQRGRSSRRCIAGRMASATPAWNSTSATMHSVGGAMFERSPGTPTIDPGYRPENTNPARPASPAHSRVQSVRRAACTSRS